MNDPQSRRGGPTLRMREIQVKGLFGTFDHRIPLTNAEPVTIIHGPNGFGKTVMLKMISAFTNGKTGIFLRVPFKEFSVRFQDSSRVVVRRHEGGTPDEKLEKSASGLSISIFNEHGSPVSTEVKIGSEITRSILDRIDDGVPSPWFVDLDRMDWRNHETGERASLDDILEMYPGARTRLPAGYEPNPFAVAQVGIDSFFIETKRLAAERASQPAFSELSLTARRRLELRESRHQLAVLRVQQYSADIVQRIKSALAYYAKHSQERDRSFPARLVRFASEGQSILPEKEIIEKMRALERERLRLINLGFLDRETTGLVDLSEDDVERAAEALTIYVGDVEQKLSAARSGSGLYS